MSSPSTSDSDILDGSGSGPAMCGVAPGDGAAPVAAAPAAPAAAASPACPAAAAAALSHGPSEAAFHMHGQQHMVYGHHPCSGCHPGHHHMGQQQMIPADASAAAPNHMAAPGAMVPYNGMWNQQQQMQQQIQLQQQQQQQLVQLLERNAERDERREEREARRHDEVMKMIQRQER
jgi:hypothetical protein